MAKKNELRLTRSSRVTERSVAGLVFLARRLVSDRCRSTKLHGRWGFFTTASADGDRRYKECDRDYRFHG
jgi:hypothetical protein